MTPLALLVLFLLTLLWRRGGLMATIAWIYLWTNGIIL